MAETDLLTVDTLKVCPSTHTQNPLVNSGRQTYWGGGLAGQGVHDAPKRHLDLHFITENLELVR